MWHALKDACKCCPSSSHGRDTPGNTPQGDRRQERQCWDKNDTMVPQIHTVAVDSVQSGPKRGFEVSKQAPVDPTRTRPSPFRTNRVLSPSGHAHPTDATAVLTKRGHAPPIGAKLVLTYYDLAPPIDAKLAFTQCGLSERSLSHWPRSRKRGTAQRMWARAAVPENMQITPFAQRLDDIRKPCPSAITLHSHYVHRRKPLYYQHVRDSAPPLEQPSFCTPFSILQPDSIPGARRPHLMALYRRVACLGCLRA